MTMIGYAVGALSQTTEPLTAEHAARGIDLTPYLQVLEDATNDLTIAEVYGPDRNNRFQPVTGSPNYGFSNVCRYGGEEFALILPATEQAEAMTLADRFRKVVGTADIQGQQLTVSIGIASANDDVQSPAGFFEAADLALYKAKSQGRDCVAFFDAAFRETVSRRQS